MRTPPFVQLFCRMAFVLPLAVTAPGLAQDTAAPAKYPLQIRFIDSATGAAIQPESVTAQPHRPAAVEQRLAAGQIGRNGRATLALERGRHTIAAVASGYRPMSGDFEMSESSPYRIQFLLEPMEAPRELQPQYMASLLQDDLMLVQGFVVDDDSGALLSGVSVHAAPSGLEASTDGSGFFQFYVPVPSQAELKLAPAGLLFEKPGYQSEQRLYVLLWPGGACTYRIRLAPGNGTQTVDERQGSRLDPEIDPLALAPSADVTAAAAMGEVVEPLGNPTPQATALTNSTIRVPRNIRVLKQDGVTIDYVDMGTYAKCVLPHEWLASWGGGTGINCLYAGAVAVRCYAISRLNGASATSTYDICGTSTCQNYNPAVTYAASDNAVNYTANWVVISGGSIPSTEYSSEDNSLQYSCGDGFTEPSTSGPVCLYDPMCYGTTRFGHGRGMCQYGSYRWAIAYRGFPHRDWTWILRHYYPSYTLVKGAPLMVGDTIKALKSLNVRACTGGTITSGAGCALVTTESTGATGTIIGGPTVVTSDGYGFTWYQVQWSDSKVGWSAENYLERVYSAPAAPTNLTATAVGASRIDLSWQDVSGGAAANFALQRANATTGPWHGLATVAASVTNYSDLKLYSGSTWYYRVYAYNAAGNSGYSLIAGATTSNSPPVLAAIPNRTNPALTTLCFTNSATAPIVQLITDFESFMSETANGVVMFRTPRYSASTSGNLGAPSTTSSLLVTPNVAAVTDTYPTGGHGTGCVLKVSCQFTNPNNPWLQLSTASAANFPNPVIDFTRQLRFDIYSDQTIRVAVGCRETTNVVGTPIGSDGGTTGSVVWAGVTNLAGSAPMPTRPVVAGTWTTLTFDFPNEPVWNYPSGGTGVLSTVSGLGVLEHLAIVPAGAIGVKNIYLDNFAVVTPPTLTYSLDSNAPPGASLTTNGVFTWTPTIAQANQSWTISVIVADNNSPPLTATNSFIVVVPQPNPPLITSQPQDRIVALGGTATYSVSAIGDLPLHYEWRFKGAPIPGATNTAFTTSAASLTNAGPYSVFVTNLYGTTLSSNALLVLISGIAGGANDFGQVSVPPAANNGVAVAAGAWHSLALRTDGKVIAWGNNDNGQCDVPSTLNSAVAIAGGGYHSLALQADGTVLAWGANDYGQTTVPADLRKVVAIAAGDWHSLALQEDGTVRAWGDDSWGQVEVPVGLAKVVAIAAGGNHDLALKADGTVAGWGQNTDAEGDFAGQSVVPRGLTNVVGIAAGEYHSLAVKGNGAVVAWGDDSQGQCDVPAQATNVVAAAGGGEHSVALTGQGSVLAWGADWNGQCEVASGLANMMGVAAGAEHTLTLLEGSVPVARLLNPGWKGGQFTVWQQTVYRKNYGLEFKRWLGAANWTSLPAVPGNGALEMLGDPGATNAPRFYRVRQW